MATYRIGIGSEFQLKDNAVGVGSTTTGLGNLIIDGTLKASGLSASGVTTFISYSGFSADEVSGKITLTGEHQTTGDIVVGTGETFRVSSGATVDVGTVESVSIGTHFSPPIGNTEDRPEVPVEGTVRFNRDLNTLEFYNGVEWRQFTVSGASGRAILGGGYSPGNTAYPDVNLITIPTTGNATNFGTLHTARTSHGACSSSIRGIFLGGNPDNDSTEYYTLASRGNGIDFGNLTSTGRRYTSSFSSSTRGFSAGGKDDPAVTNEIDYCEIAQLNTWLDFGDLTVAALYWGGLSSPTRGLTLVADDPASQVINSVTIASKGDATDFGKQMGTGGYQSAAANSVRGLWAGGYASSPRQAVGYTKVIQKITIASSGNASYFGELTGTKLYGDGSSTSTRGVFAGSASQYSNVIEYVTIESSGNAIDFGDLPMATGYHGMTSDSHGGLGGY